MSTNFTEIDRPNNVSTDGLFEVIRHSLCINRHIEFFMWLQAYVTDYIPHDVLVATWGDFNSDRLHYDVASNVPAIHTQQLDSGCNEIDPLMRELYTKWLENESQEFVINDFNKCIAATDYSGALIDSLKPMRSVLVYGYRDHRGENDCLYAFFGSRHLNHIQDYVLNMIMPHIDATLRRIECLPDLSESNQQTAVVQISEREHDVMTWVKQGKTNDEIAIILGISPNTVKNHLKNIYKKMEVCTRAQAVALYQSKIESHKEKKKSVVKRRNVTIDPVYCEGSA